MGARLCRLFIGFVLCFSLVPLAGTAAWADEDGATRAGQAFEEGLEGDVGIEDGTEAPAPHTPEDRDGGLAPDEGGDTSGQGGFGQEPSGEAAGGAFPEQPEAPVDDDAADLALAAATYTIEYRAHVAMAGWQGWVKGGERAGTTGRSRSIEALEIRLKGTGLTGSVEYRAHVQNRGWMGWAKDGAVAGTTGRARQVEAVQVRLTGELAGAYDVYYRAHLSNIGWMGWAANGEAAGAPGLAGRLEAVQVRLVEKGGKAPGATANPSATVSLEAQACVDTKGWLKKVGADAVIGTTGQSLLLESFWLRVAGSSRPDKEIPGSIEYRAHVQDTGWQNWVASGAPAGAGEGSGLRIEAVQIRLTGDLAQYFDVYYRAHLSNIGWMGWAKNGASAGTSRVGYRAEALRVVLVAKGGPAPGSTSGAYRESVSILSALNSAKGSKSITTFGGFSLSRTGLGRLQGAVDSVRSRGYSVGFIMVDLTTGKGIAYNVDQSFYSASTIKGPYVACLGALKPASVPAWRSTMEATIRQSSNEGYSSLRRAFGAAPMRTWCSEAGVSTAIANSDYTYLSARDLSKLWLRNYTYFTSGASNSAQVQSWYTSSLNSVIRHNLGSRYYMNTKPGWIGSNLCAANDAGIVWAQGRPYIVAIMSNSPGNMRVLDQLVLAIDGAHNEML
ncbi:MAG: serine hydrolase [Eggerthellaceae bacterium]|nr:serine hydrolase [Eggerthellaceae bacterium]